MKVTNVFKMQIKVNNFCMERYKNKSCIKSKNLILIENQCIEKSKKNTYKNYDKNLLKNKENNLNKIAKKENDFFIKGNKFFAIFCLFFLTLFFVAVGIFFVIQNKNGDEFFEYFSSINNAEFCYVLDDNFVENTSDRNVETMNCQFVYFNEKTDYINNQNVLYKQVVFWLKNYDEKNILNSFNITIIKREYVSGISIIYGYSPSFSKTLRVGGAKINFQIAINSERVTIGYPMIFGAF